MLLDPTFGGDGHILWAGSLWLSAIACTSLTANLRIAVQPALGCTFAFGVFALAYFMCEGPFFGNVSQGGDPATTNVVFWNLVFLPLGVFLASDVGSRLRAVQERKIEAVRRPANSSTSCEK